MLWQHRITALLLLSVFLTVLSAPSVLHLHFKLNQKEITEKFCENKAEPELKCNGQCHLAKTFKKLETRKEQPAEKEATSPTFQVIAYFEKAPATPSSDFTFATYLTDHYYLLDDGYQLDPERPPTV